MHLRGDLPPTQNIGRHQIALRKKAEASKFLNHENSYASTAAVLASGSNTPTRDHECFAAPDLWGSARPLHGRLMLKRKRRNPALCGVFSADTGMTWPRTPFGDGGSTTVVSKLFYLAFTGLLYHMMYAATGTIPEKLSARFFRTANPLLLHHDRLTLLLYLFFFFFGIVPRSKELAWKLDAGCAILRHVVCEERHNHYSVFTIYFNKKRMSAMTLPVLPICHFQCSKSSRQRYPYLRSQPNSTAAAVVQLLL